MAGLLVDVLEVEALDVVVLADGVDALVDALPELAIEDEEYLGRGVVALEVVEQLRHRGTEIIELLCCPVAIDIVAHRGSAPGVVGAAADEDDVGIAEGIAAADERAVAVVAVFGESLNGHAGLVAFLVAGIADGGAGEGVVLLKGQALGAADELMPPGFLYLRHVVPLVVRRTVALEVPDMVGVAGHIALKGRVAIAQDRNLLREGKTPSRPPQGEEEKES